MSKKEVKDFYRSFQGGGFMDVAGWEPLDGPPESRRSIPYKGKPPVNNSPTNSYINDMLAKILSYNKEGKAVVNPHITSSGRPVSKLERLFKVIEPKGDFIKFFSFLSHTAEAESFSGDVTENKSSSAAGDFHILTDNNKNGGTSSFDTGKQRIRNLKRKFGDLLSRDPEVIKTLDTIIEAKSPADLTKEEQAMFVFVDLKMKSNNLKDFLLGKLKGSDLYSREWVTEGSQNHSKQGILTNWLNADKRLSKEQDRIASAEQYFGIKVQDKITPVNMKDEVGRVKFEQQQKLNTLSPSFRSGGKIINSEHNYAEIVKNIRNSRKLF
jgi:hypothetical protein